MNTQIDKTELLLIDIDKNLNELIEFSKEINYILSHQNTDIQYIHDTLDNTLQKIDCTNQCIKQIEMKENNNSLLKYSLISLVFVPPIAILFGTKVAIISTLSVGSTYIISKLF